MDDEAKLAAAAALQAAQACGGVVSELSAALVWDWSVKAIPPRPQLTVRKNRRFSRDRLEGIEVRRLNLPSYDVVNGVTSRLRTVLDCARRQPFDAALAVADSALRTGTDRDELEAAARSAGGPGAIRVRRVAACADGRAANAFESCARAICLSVPGLHVEPQVSIRDPHLLGRPDLVDERLRIVIEADSFEWHGGRAALRSDAVRYNRFVVNGWLVLRFCWEDIMFRPAEVRAILIAAVAERTNRVTRDRSGRSRAS